MLKKIMIQILAIVLLCCSAKAAFVDNHNGTVTDTSTGLTWQQATATGTYTWQQALAYCENLDLGDHTDWRLPTIKELDSIVDLSRYNPAINTTYFPNTAASWYWSSTTYAYYTGLAWGMAFGNGYDGSYDKYGNGYVRAVRGGQSGSLGNSVIAMSPMSGPAGTTFVEWGTGFTPNTTATLHFLKPDATEYPTMPQPIDAIGHFEIAYRAPYDKPVGAHSWWAIDGVTGEKSNVVTFMISPLSTNLDVQTINPQSDQSFYENFFPSPKSDQLVFGGRTSNVIAADGESYLLLRIMADNDPGQVTISESDGNPGQNGSLATLDNYRNASPASSVSIQLRPYDGRYFGFAVYKAPKDFTIPGYENRLTRPITLNVSSSAGNVDVPLTLRRPPIIISHGLWSCGWGNEEIKSFRNTLWNQFEDNGGMDINDYIWLNDCVSQNASAVIVGASKTRNNIKEYLHFLRNRGATVTQVDYLGHSMGGLWGRLVEQGNGKDVFTYDKGYLNKLVTLNSPHEGSFIADIGQFALDTADFEIYPFPNARDYLCAVSNDYQMPVCSGAIEDLTATGCSENLKDIKVPSHAIIGNKHIDTACTLLSASTWIGGQRINTLLKIMEWMLKKIDSGYGCENWFNQFDFSTETDYVVDLYSQKGGLSGTQLSLFEYKHTASFNSDVNNCFFDLLNKGVDDNAFADGFPESSTLLGAQKQFPLKALPGSAHALENQIPLGEIQFISPANGATVSPGEQINVELGLTGTLTLNDLLIMAPGSDPVELFNPPYTTSIQIPTDVYGNFVISALGQGTDGNLYSASITLSVNNTAALESISVSPESLYMDLGQTIDLEVTGTYSDGTARSLNSNAQGTTYTSSDETIVSVNENGTVTANAVGIGYIQVRTISGEPVIIKVEVSAPYLDADFSADQPCGAAPVSVNFTDLSAGYVTTWNWNFGDGQTSTEQNPNHTYNETGAYTVSLTVTDADGNQNIETKNSQIQVHPMGDINGDYQVDLEDAVLALQIAVGIEPGQAIYDAADVNNDGKIGIEEAIYIMEKVAGVRE